MMEQYKKAAFGELSPHPFAIADNAYGYFVKPHCQFYVVSVKVLSSQVEQLQTDD